MGTDWVEVSQHDALDVSATMDIVGNNLLVNFLGVTVWRSSLLVRSILSNRQVLRFWLTVNGAGRREDDTLYIILWHELKQVDERNQVVAVVEQRLLHALAHSLAGSKVDNTLDSWILLEHGLCCSLVTQVHLLESRANACDFLNTVEYLDLRVREVIYDYYVVASLLQLYCGMATDEACTACYQNCLFHYR